MSPRPRLAALLSALALVVASGAGASARAADPPTASEGASEALSGHYAFTGGDAQRSAIDQAIEAAIQNLQGPIRDLARKRLQDTNSVPSEIILALDESTRKVSLDRRTIRTRAGRTALYTDHFGNTSRVTHRVDESELHERLVAADGERHNDFVIDEDGARLTLKVRIQSSHLAKPVVYTLTYARR